MCCLVIKHYTKESTGCFSYQCGIDSSGSFSKHFYASPVPFNNKCVLFNRHGSDPRSAINSL